MVVLAEDGALARKNTHGGRRPNAGRKPTSERDDKAVKMDRTLAAKAAYVAELRGISLAEYLTEASRATIERDFAKTAKGDDSSGHPK